MIDEAAAETGVGFAASMVTCIAGRLAGLQVRFSASSNYNFVQCIIS